MTAGKLRKILCVEDEEDVRRIIALALGRLGGLDVKLVADPLAAVDAMAAFGPDLVLLDCSMPGLDGMGVVKAMREQVHTRDLPVVMLTARADRRSLEALRAMGIAGVITKPFSALTLASDLVALWQGIAPRRAACA
jgi:CheY-like chemotaxis protein